MLAPFTTAPTGQATQGLDLCGQGASYVQKVCPVLPATKHWNRGVPVRGNDAIAVGTVIATFDTASGFKGHAAIYVGQNLDGIQVYDQYVTAACPKPVGPRTLLWGASGNTNDGNEFYVVE